MSGTSTHQDWTLGLGEAADDLAKDRVGDRVRAYGSLRPLAATRTED